MKTLTLAALAASAIFAQQSPAPAKADAATETISTKTWAGEDAKPILTESQKLALRDDERIKIAAERQRDEALQRYMQSAEYKALDFAAMQAAQQFQRTVNEVAKAIGCPDCSINLNTWVVTHPPQK